MLTTISVYLILVQKGHLLATGPLHLLAILPECPPWYVSSFCSHPSTPSFLYGVTSFVSLIGTLASSTSLFTCLGMFCFVLRSLYPIKKEGQVRGRTVLFFVLFQSFVHSRPSTEWVLAECLLYKWMDGCRSLLWASPAGPGDLRGTFWVPGLETSSYLQLLWAVGLDKDSSLAIWQK